MQNIRMVATDLDGTFFDDAKHINHAKFDKVLRYFEEHNMRFVIATGNDKRVVDRIFADFCGRYDYVINNGGVVIDAEQNRYREAELSFSDLEDITMALHDANVTWLAGIVYTGENEHYMHEDFKGVGERFHMLKTYVPDLKYIESLKKLSQDHIYKISFDCLTEEVDNLISTLNDIFGNRFHITTSGYGSVDIIPANVNKATGLIYLLDHFKIQPNEVMAFGDGMNDYEMLQYVGYPISMPNGDEKLIDEFPVAIADNNHDGVLDTIIKELNIQ